MGTAEAAICRVGDNGVPAPADSEQQMLANQYPTRRREVTNGTAALANSSRGAARARALAGHQHQDNAKEDQPHTEPALWRDIFS